MKKLSSLFVSLLCSLLMLASAGCSSGIIAKDDTTEDTTVTETINEDEIITYTAADIAEAFNANINVEGLGASYCELDDFVGYWLGLYLNESNDDSEKNLQEAAYILAGFLPEFIELFSETYYEATDVSDAEYCMIFTTKNFSAAAEIYAYLNYGERCVEIYIYDTPSGGINNK